VRLLELHVQNVRGIRELHLRPEGKNQVVWGPNGSGKSTIVDAIDFLLTGNISRLTGAGTGGISLHQHGHHIESTPERAVVRAVVQLSNSDERITLERCMAQPGRLVVGPCSDRPGLDRALEVAKRGQHILTRRDILHFITAAPMDRAVQVQQLLNIAEIEEIRATFVKVRGELERAAATERRSASTHWTNAAATAGLTRYTPDAMLEAVNRHREVLSGAPLAELRADTLQEGLTPPGSQGGANGPNLQLVQQDVERLREAVSQALLTAEKPRDEQLRLTLQTLRGDPQAQRATDWQRLAQLGLTLMDDEGACPLCATAWPPGELQERVEAQIQLAAALQAQLAEIADATKRIRRYTDAVLALARNVHRAAAALGDDQSPGALRGWIETIEQLIACLDSPFERYPDAPVDACGFFEVLSAAEIPAVLEDVLALAHAALPQTSPAQTAWDALTRVQVSLQAAEEQAARARSAEQAYTRAATLLSEFLAARDGVLESLYASVQDRFVDLYRQIHEEDENQFTASLVPDGAGLDMSVTFHGRGAHPPHALHSEGHQDSMGICLFLALAEKLADGVLDLIILDDVVMSVDADHRRQVGQMLATSFPGKQFLIVTHDRTWSNQLRSVGVVTHRTTMEFFGWSLAAGPQVSAETDQWERIERALAEGDVPGAAAKLRRGAEEFFASTCDALRGKVPYKLTGRWELGDFMPAAISEYKALLRKAKQAAGSWENAEEVGHIEEMESTCDQIVARTQSEQWAVNTAVHYNEWSRLAPDDFRPVVEAFRDLFGVFRCVGCDGTIALALSGMAPTNLRCSCSAVDLNLVSRPRVARTA
jgi:recombinational DNA repair ATPase RecF